MAIALASILSFEHPKTFKVHLARWNGTVQPLDEFVSDRDQWRRWNTWKYGINDFNRPYLLALIDFYPERHIWLLGGVYRVLGSSPESYTYAYTVEELPDYTDFVGRLKIHFDGPRNRSVTLERYLSDMTVVEILREPYAGERFPGYENINHDFFILETVIRSQRPDWRAALENVKGIYLIADKTNGKLYVGSAYGDSGIWARWQCYIETGHGHTDELTRVIRREGIDYARQNLRLSLLEYRPAKTDDQVIIDREQYWKRAVLSGQPLGYNRN